MRRWKITRHPSGRPNSTRRLVPGSIVTEAVFHHRASGTLILTDLIENFEPSRVRKVWLRTLLRFGRRGRSERRSAG